VRADRSRVATSTRPAEYSMQSMLAAGCFGLPAANVELLDEQHLAICGERPEFVRDEQLELVSSFSQRVHCGNNCIAEMLCVLFRRPVPFMIEHTLELVGTPLELVRQAGNAEERLPALDGPSPPPSQLRRSGRPVFDTRAPQAGCVGLPSGASTGLRRSPSCYRFRA
jgi:hypothetical protein